eukprot:m.61394 g.61394  ORF g.61394 m.61394 type:complete len:429 (-) comp13874_c0_seq2:137-1423(-)
MLAMAPVLEVNLTINKHLEKFTSIEDASDKNMVLLDGFRPDCQDCICYNNLPKESPPVELTFRRYQVLHHQIRQGLRPMRAITFSLISGHGWADRLKLILSLFYQALMDDAAFFVNINEPSPLSLSFGPGMVDWRPTNISQDFTRSIGLKGRDDGPCKNLGALRSRLPSELQHEDASPVSVNVVGSAYLVPCLWHLATLDFVLVQKGKPPSDMVAPLANHEAAARYGLPQLTSPVATAYDTLFEPRPRLLELRREFGLQPDQLYLALHLRTGVFKNGRGDRRRLRASQFETCFECMAKYEELNKLHANTKWYIASDHSGAAQSLKDWLVATNRSADKAVSLHDIGGVIEHIDKYMGQSGKDGDPGELFAYLDFLMLQGADVIASESGFNVMAAATSYHQSIIFVPSCKQLPSPEQSEEYFGLINKQGE